VAIVSSCDASPVFQLAEHALDDIAAPIDLLIERVWGPSDGGRWDDGLDLSSLVGRVLIMLTWMRRLTSVIGGKADMARDCHCVR